MFYRVLNAVSVSQNMIPNLLSFKQDAANVLVIGTESSAKEYDPGIIFFFR